MVWNSSIHSLQVLNDSLANASIGMYTLLSSYPKHRDHLVGAITPSVPRIDSHPVVSFYIPYIIALMSRWPPVMPCSSSDDSR